MSFNGFKDGQRVEIDGRVGTLVLPPIVFSGPRVESYSVPQVLPEGYQVVTIRKDSDGELFRTEWYLRRSDLR